MIKNFYFIFFRMKAGLPAEINDRNKLSGNLHRKPRLLSTYFIFFRMKAGRIVLLSLALVSGGCGLVFYDAFLKALDIRGILFAAATMLIFSCSMIAMQIFLRR